MIARIRKSIEEKDAGFTLIELLVVIIIIGILAAIAIPVFLSQRKKGYDAQAKSDLRNIATAEETYLTDHPAGYVACDSTTATTGCATVLGFKPSSAATTSVGVDAANGYCAVSKTTSTNYWVYDSQAGGLQPTSTSAFPTTWPTGGTCAVTTARPASF